MSKTITIRIPVAVDARSRWLAYGWEGVRGHEEMLEAFDYDTIGPCESLFWVTVTLPVPEATEIQPDAVDPVNSPTP